MNRDWTHTNGEIMRDGRPVPLDQVVKTLNAGERVRLGAREVASTHSRRSIWSVVRRLQQTLDATAGDHYGRRDEGSS